MAMQILEQWEALISRLPPNWRLLADEHKQLQVQYGNAKITNADDLLRLILVHAAADLPLRQTVALVAESGGPDVSPVTLHKKMMRASGFLYALVRAVVSVPSQFSPEKWGGYDVTSVDGSTICALGSVSGEARIHLRMRLATLEFLDVSTAGIDVGESFYRYKPAHGELLLGDRMYCTLGGIAHVVEHGADVLVRVNRKSLPVRQGKDVVEYLPLLRTLSTHRVYDKAVTLSVKRDGETKLIHGRLLVQKLPAHKAEIARKRLRKELGKKMAKLTTDSLEAAGYVVLFTTVPAGRLSASQCMKLYRLRWQIELQFKRWKSICGFDRMPNFKPQTILSWLYAKILASVLLESHASQESVVSPPILCDRFDEAQSQTAVEDDSAALAIASLSSHAGHALSRAPKRRVYH